MKQDMEETLREFLNRKLYISPSMAKESSYARFDATVYLVVDRISKDFVALYWTDTEKNETFGEFPISERIPRIAVYEILASTAWFIANENGCGTEISHEYIQIALCRLQLFIIDYGFGSIVKLYQFVSYYEDAQALLEHGKIPEHSFILGTWHRPWVDYSLNDELIWGAMIGNYQIKLMDGGRYVSLTEKGKEYLHEIKTLLLGADYWAIRNGIQDFIT